jgi:ABC-type transport system involved in cytochrome bd biosynthesis fused ATPase/permease subunit
MLSEKFKKFFNKKMETIDLIDKINSDRNQLKKDLDQFIKRANAFSASSKSSDIQKEIMGMEKKFKDIDRKKNTFEREIKKLCSLVRKKGR